MSTVSLRPARKEPFGGTLTSVYRLLVVSVPRLTLPFTVRPEIKRPVIEESLLTCTATKIESPMLTGLGRTVSIETAGAPFAPPLVPPPPLIFGAKPERWSHAATSAIAAITAAHRIT